MTHSTTAGLVAALMIVATSGSAWAGSVDTAQGDAARRSIAALAANGAQNVPDLQGCVRWCERDLNPCDPPAFKRTDGRCGEP